MAFGIGFSYATPRPAAAAASPATASVGVDIKWKRKKKKADPPREDCDGTAYSTWTECSAAATFCGPNENQVCRPRHDGLGWLYYCGRCEEQPASILTGGL